MHIERPNRTTDTCNPTLCALGATPHAHCACGLPMAATAALCAQCRAEGFIPQPLKLSDHDDEWDGRRYPARRRNRPAGIPAARYDDLLLAILGRRVQPPTAQEAA